MPRRESLEFAHPTEEETEAAFYRRRRQLINNLVTVTELAADLMRRSLSGESVFSNNDERQAALALIKLFPALNDRM
jgi:hypothetical protein